MTTAVARLPIFAADATYQEEGVAPRPAHGKGHAAMPDDTPSTEPAGNGNGGSLWSRIYELGARLGLVERAIERHDQYGPRLEAVERDIAAIRGDVATINEHLDQQDTAAAQRQQAEETRLGELKELLNDDMNQKLTKVLEIQERDHKATERRLLIAEGALASYVAGEQHRRERTRNIERAVYGTGATILTGLILVLFGQFFSHPHSGATLGSDAIAVAAILILVLADFYMAWRVAALTQQAPATHPTPTPDPPARLP